MNTEFTKAASGAGQKTGVRGNTLKKDRQENRSAKAGTDFAKSRSASTNETRPVKLKPHSDPTEKPLLPVPSPLRPERRVGYALVGLGNLSLNQILPAFTKCQYSRVVALVSGDAKKAAKVALQYGIAPENLYDYGNFDGIRDNPAIDAVYIVLPNSMHEEFTLRAAAAGKHVLCEKPLSVSAASAQKMVDSCKKAGVKLMTAYRIQYEPVSQQCMKWMRERKFGDVRIINTFNGQNIGDPQQWRLKKALAGGGALPDIGIYNINTARYLSGEEPYMVIASSFSTPGDERFREVEETLMFQLFFPSGLLVNNTCSYGVHESRHYHCYADKGAVFGVRNAFAYSGLQLEVSQMKDKMEWRSEPSAGGDKDQFMLEIDHMSDCILNKRQPYTPGEEGVQDHRIMEAVYEAARSGKPVRLDRIDKKDTFRGPEPHGG